MEEELHGNFPEVSTCASPPCCDLAVVHSRHLLRRRVMSEKLNGIEGFGGEKGKEALGKGIASG
jgi:hypothetical protein